MIEKAPAQAPDWLDAEPDAWPPEIRRAYVLMARIAQRKLDREKADSFCTGAA